MKNENRKKITNHQTEFSKRKKNEVQKNWRNMPAIFHSSFCIYLRTNWIGLPISSIANYNQRDFQFFSINWKKVQINSCYNWTYAFFAQCFKYSALVLLTQSYNSKHNVWIHLMYGHSMFIFNNEFRASKCSSNYLTTLFFSIGIKRMETFNVVFIFFFNHMWIVLCGSFSHL